MLKICTWNVNSLKVRLPQTLSWLGEHQPDILALQETKLQDADFPAEEISKTGYHAVFSGQKTYNGMAILSKTKPYDIQTDIIDLDDHQRRILIATVGDIRVINLYVPNGESLESAKYTYKLQWLENITAHIQQELKNHKKCVVLGDFNIAPEERDVHDPAAWKDTVLFSTTARQALSAIVALGLQDSFRLFPQPDKSYSWWDYRGLAFRRNHGLRIDHILITSDLATACVSCQIDKMARKVERPSDHAPVVAEFRLDSSMSTGL